MAQQSDSLTVARNLDRVHFQTGILLDADDFITEQNYHRGRLARALNYASGSGTMAGLKVLHEAAQAATTEASEQPERLKIHSGLAVDRLGRLIEVPATLCIRLDRWYQQQDDTALRNSWKAAGALWTDSIAGICVDLFIRFVPCERGKQPVFNGNAGSLDAITAARLRDGYTTELRLRDEAHPGLPVNRWPDLSGSPAQQQAQLMRAAIFDAWYEGSIISDENRSLPPLAEHAAAQDTTFLMLARMILPADEAAPGARPQRRLADTVVVRNDVRSFVVSANALARMLGIPLNDQDAGE